MLRLLSGAGAILIYYYNATPFAVSTEVVIPKRPVNLTPASSSVARPHPHSELSSEACPVDNFCKILNTAASR